MKVVLRTDGPVRRWHRHLDEMLALAGHSLVIRRVPCSRDLPFGLNATLAGEHMVYGAGAGLFTAVGIAPPEDETQADLVIELRFNGVAGEHALIAALLARQVPLVEICDVTGQAANQVLAAGLPAVEAPPILSHALDHILVRTQTLVAQAVRDARANVRLPMLSEPMRAGVAAPPAVFLSRTLAANLVRRFRPTRRRMPNWRVALRVANDSGTALARAWPAAAFHPLPHDGQRFQADPFLLAHEGRTCLFFEDFPFATEKGVIAMVEIDGSGRPSQARTVLELPFHLSYPHVFIVDTIAYMLPEMNAAGRVQLFRADPFPDRWVADRVLLDGVNANDATLILHDGLWWLFATLSGDGGSSWDALGLFYATHPFGPWTPHVNNPVLIDAGSARPAGEMWHENGVLMRIAQDCRRGYGAGLAICRVDRLDPNSYSQTIITRLGAPPAQGDSVHTLNCMGGFEMIDLKGPWIAAQP